MKALVLEKAETLFLRDIEIEETLGDTDVKIKIMSCGICGSDLHFFREGRIGDFVVKSPMVLGHEASGIILEKGKNVNHLNVGDRVCMEPGIFFPYSDEAREGNYNLDPNVRFWATPPVHGVLRETVIHPSILTYKLPENISFQVGAMVEPFVCGVESVKKANIRPGDVAVITGAGTIGIMTAIAAVLGGCSKVIISDVINEKLKIAESFGNIIGVNISSSNLEEVVLEHTNGRGADCLFEASGNSTVFPDVLNLCKRSGRVVLIGMFNQHVPFDITQIQVRGLQICGLFRYANCYVNAIRFLAESRVNLETLISKVFNFDEAITAYNFASGGRKDVVKVMIDL